MELRYYQRDAIDSLYRYFETNNGNPLIVLPTGTGKSLVMAKLIEEAVTSWPDTRIIVATHVKELVCQDYAEFVGICPLADAGVYSAGLNRKDTHNQILFTGIQSAYRRAFDFQKCDLLIIDEAHTVPPEGEGMWRTFIDELTRINPQMKIIGLTATDYRMSSGLLTDGDIFTDVCYEYSLLKAVTDGYLAPVVPKNMTTEYDLSGVGTRGGEYIAGELEKAVDVDNVTIKAIDEIELYGAKRNSWLIFAAGNSHAEHIHLELAKRGYTGAVVTQDTDRAARDKAVSDIRSGVIRYLVNNRIFTTGFNAPNIDLIADMGPTKSPGLHVQKMGRGMRLYDGKENCLVLDFARNVDYHGPLDQIKGKSKTKGSGDAPVKICSECNQVLFAGIRICPYCGYEFEMGGVDIRGHGGSAPLLSSQIEPEWRNVLGVEYRRNTGKEGKRDTLMVSYITIEGVVREWICFNHDKGSWAWKKAQEWHRGRGHKLQAPDNVAMALEYVYAAPTRILVKPDGKFYRILEYDFNKPEEKETFEIVF